MSLGHAISQRDLRLHSREIMDAVEQGQTFTVTRDGREIGDLTPLRRDNTFVSAEDFLAVGRGLPSIDSERFRSDVDGVAVPFLTDPYER
jgi:antitoxin (DNA-binding transcriptional repressor) of toxin-antitoxin stability system